MKYQTIPEKIDAEIYDGSLTSYIAIHALIKSVDPRIAVRTKRGQVCYSMPDGSFHKIPRGSYIIASADNKLSQLSFKEFNKRYVPAEAPRSIPKAYNWYNRTTGQSAICFKHLNTRFSRACIINSLGSLPGISFEIEPSGELIACFSGSRHSINEGTYVLHEHGSMELILIPSPLDLETRYGYSHKENHKPK